MSAWLAALAALALASPAAAAPKGTQAKAAFDRGVAAYQKGSFAAASEALATSFKLEPDAETLFAWAQSERQLEHCEKSIELFEKLLGFDMPAENKKVVQSKIDECKALLPAKQPEPEPAKQPEPPSDSPDKAMPPPADTSASGPESSPWWKDPIGDALVGAGVVGLGVGGYFLMSASQAEKDSQKRDSDFQEKDKLARSHGRIGVISTIAGGALVVGGIVRYVTRSGGSGGKERAAVTGWLSPGGGGITAIGRF